MGEDPRINWRQANPFAIEIDSEQDAWHAGNVRDVLELDTGGVVVATESGGIWQIMPNAEALALTDALDDTDTNCLAFGPDGPRHFYAGCEGGALLETDPSSAFPLFNWQRVSGLPDTGQIFKVLVLQMRRRIVIAAYKGIFWSVIPEAGMTGYHWKRAIDDQSLTGKSGYWRIALGWTGEGNPLGFGQDLSTVTIVAGGMADDTTTHGLFYGQWNSQDDQGDLIMKRASLHDKSGVNLDLLQVDMGPVSVASCATLPNFCYAACSAADSSLLMVVRSTDGGRTWTSRGIEVKGTSHNLVHLAGEHGGDRNNCIAVSQWNADYVGLAWENGPFTSLDGGNTWMEVKGGSVHLHGDLHVVYFPPIRLLPDGNPRHRLYVGGDGGLVFTDDLAALDRKSFISMYNRHLLNLQCSQPVPGGRGFYGSMAISSKVPGLVSTGLQDHDNCYALIGPSPTPWRHIDMRTGDGGNNVFAEEFLVRDVHGENPDPPLRQAHWSGTALVDDGVMPVTIPGSSAASSGLVDAWVSPVEHPQGGSRPVALAGKNSEVYGAFFDAQRQYLEWRYLGSVTMSPPVDITALGSKGGSTVFVGTADGRMFAFDTALGSASQLPVVLSPPSPTAVLSGPGTVGRITMADSDVAFATLNGVRWTGVSQDVNYVLGLSTLQWIISSVSTDQMFYAVETDWTTFPATVFAATESKVYVSRDAGGTWESASSGLPKHPRCSDLRFVQDEQGTYLSLSTWGRSVWITHLDGN